MYQVRWNSQLSFAIKPLDPSSHGLWICIIQNLGGGFKDLFISARRLSGLVWDWWGNIFFFQSYLEKWSKSDWYFSDGLKPPTRDCIRLFRYTYRSKRAETRTWILLSPFRIGSQVPPPSLHLDAALRQWQVKVRLFEGILKGEVVIRPSSPSSLIYF